MIKRTVPEAPPLEVGDIDNKLPMRTGLKLLEAALEAEEAPALRLAAPRGLGPTLAPTAACTAAPRPRGRPIVKSEAPISPLVVEIVEVVMALEAAEDIGERLSMPQNLSHFFVHRHASKFSHFFKM